MSGFGPKGRLKSPNGEPSQRSRSGDCQAHHLSDDGNTAIVGGPCHNPGGPNCQTGNPNGSPNIGAAWILTRSGGSWSQQAKLVGTGAIGSAQQGMSVSLSADGNTAIVGGPCDNPGNTNCLNGSPNAGAAWVFTPA
jgi:hypothetical protein